MDGREHPDPDFYVPTFFGHSVGHWEGDTLVIDTVGFNERFWFARRPTGMVHTDALHLIERISRPTFDTLRYEVTIDDRFAPGTHKYVCTPHEIMDMVGTITVEAAQ